MGAGRKTTTISLKERSEDSWKVNTSAPARNLTNVELGAIIFGCKHSTIKECLEKELFGLPAGHYPYVRKATPGLTVFLFNYSDRKLHGIFEAVTSGQMNINPKAWITSGEGAATTPYPAQVRIRAKCRCRPLLEEEMKPIIANNYYAEKFFWFELDKEQTKRLTALFQSSPWPEKVLLPSNANWKKNDFNVPFRSNVIKTVDEQSKDVDSEHHFGMAHSNASISYSDPYSPEKKWSELFKPSSSSSAVNNAEVVKPQNVLNPFISECLDVEWELPSNCNASSELPPPEVCTDAANAECDSYVVECWEDSNLVDDYAKEIFDNSVQYQDEEESGRPNPRDVPSSENAAFLDGWGDMKLNYVQAKETVINTKANNGSSIPLAPNAAFLEGWGDLKLDYVQTEETLIDTKASNGSSILLAPVVDYGRDRDQLNLRDSSAQEDNNVLSERELMDMITKITHEIEELKVSQLNQSLKIETLEQELVNSKQEIVELKKRYQKLECLEIEDSTSLTSKSSD